MSYTNGPGFGFSRIGKITSKKSNSLINYKSFNTVAREPDKVPRRLFVLILVQAHGRLKKTIDIYRRL